MENTVYNTFQTRKGGIKININGFIYEKNREYKDKYYWVCELRRNLNYKCNVRIITKLSDEQKHELICKQIPNHNHEPNASREMIQNAINKLKEDAVSNLFKPPIQIIADNEFTTSSSILPLMPSNSCLKQTIYRQRKKAFTINEPQDIMFELKQEYFLNVTNEPQQEKNNQIIVIDKKYDVNRRIIIFTAMKLLSLMCQSKYIIIQVVRTFKVVPKIFHQLYTIHGCVQSSTTFPLVFALCTNKDKNTYNLLLTTIIEYCDANGLHLSPRFILMDFEKTAHLCAKNIFENAIIKGCNFHLGQIIYRQVQKKGFQKLYGTNMVFATQIKCLYALAFLPEDDIPIYYDEWRKNISSEAETIAAWFGQNYVWGTITSPPLFPPKVWSTYQLSLENIPRTQNNAEAWHNRFAHLVSRHHPGFYFFAKKVSQEITHQLVEIQKLELGSPSPAKIKKYSNRITRLEKIISNKNQYTSKSSFLEAISNNLTLK